MWSAYEPQCFRGFLTVTKSNYDDLERGEKMKGKSKFPVDYEFFHFDVRRSRKWIHAAAQQNNNQRETSNLKLGR